MEGRLIEFGEFQTIAKSILKRVCEFCEKNGLKYFLSYGTLIGAVRHGDMIPWDYDIDIMMPREDLNKFLELTKNQDAIENVTVFSWVTHKDYYIPFVKVCDSRTRLVITKTTNPLPLGIWVDMILSVDWSVEKECFDKKDTDELIKLPFGDREYYCPSGYDAILTKQYGDYMTLPPEEQRAIPKIKAYMIKE